MTEDDTYDALRRIPYTHLIDKLEYRHHLVYNQITGLRLHNRYHASMRRKDAFRRKFNWMLGPPEPMYLLATTEQIFKENHTPAHIDMPDGSGWNFDSYIAEINKEMDAKETLEKKRLSKRNRFYNLTALLVGVSSMLFTPYMPFWAVIPICIVYGLVTGAGSIWIYGLLEKHDKV